MIELRAAGGSAAGMDGVVRANEGICMRACRRFCLMGVTTRQTFRRYCPPATSPLHTPLLTPQCVYSLLLFPSIISTLCSSAHNSPSRLCSTSHHIHPFLHLTLTPPPSRFLPHTPLHISCNPSILHSTFYTLTPTAHFTPFPHCPHPAIAAESRGFPLHWERGPAETRDQLSVSVMAQGGNGRLSPCAGNA